jgi:putative oxidoreductase
LVGETDSGEEAVMFESKDFRDVWAPRLLSVVRILLGLLYMQHGLSKYFGFPAPAPQNFQMFSLIGLAGVIEIVGGLMVALGCYTRWAAFIVSGEMAVAFFIVRNRLSVSFFPAVNGGQLEAVYCLFFFMFFLIGGGAWSLDRLRKIP